MKTDKAVSLCGQASAHTATAIPFLFLSQLQLCGVFAYCNILRVRPQGRNTKPHHPGVPSSMFFLPVRQICSMFPPSIAFGGHVLMAWNILSLFSQPDLPSARFHLGCSFSICPYPRKGVLSVCTASGAVVLLAVCTGAPSPPPWDGGMQRLVWCNSRGPEVRTPESRCVWDLVCISVSLGFSIPTCETEGRFFNPRPTRVWSRTHFAEVRFKCTL